jgi:hypothetical protein
MTTTIIRRGAVVVRVVVSEEPFPTVQASRLEREGFTVVDETHCTIRVGPVSGFVQLADMLTQKDLFT